MVTCCRQFRAVNDFGLDCDLELGSTGLLALELLTLFFEEHLMALVLIIEFGHFDFHFSVLACCNTLVLGLVAF